MRPKLRNFFLVLPDQIKIMWYRLKAWLNALALRSVDRYLAQRNEHRVPSIVKFEELPIIYSRDNFLVLYDRDSFPGIADFDDDRDMLLD